MRSGKHFAFSRLRLLVSGKWCWIVIFNCLNYRDFHGRMFDAPFKELVALWEDQTGTNTKLENLSQITGGFREERF